MNEKYKKAVYSIIYRTVICALLLCAAFLTAKYFPKHWSYVRGLLDYNADFNRAGNCLREFVAEILPI